MANISVFCFLASYLLTFVLEWTRLLRRSSINQFVTLLVAAAGFVAHSLYLWMRGRELAMPPLLSSGHDWLLVLAWTTMLFYLFLMLFDPNLGIGLFLLPLVLLLIGATYFVSGSSPDVPLDARYGRILLHAASIMFGMAGIILGLVLSMMYLFQHSRLKHKQRLKGGLTLPSLERLARLNWWAIVVSVPLLTVGMVTGIWVAVASQKGAAPLITDPVILGNGVVWILMISFLVWLVKTRRPAGRQVAWLTIWAFGFLLVTLVGLQIVTGGAHVELSSPSVSAGS